ncbi:hypothetical protein LJR030_003639 [Rhizobium sp. LjRoot30]|uniref:hypothetical protein n=1 Tax=Rhizobium sp. LjRoot30 TaxID=3342320 RepID=UPI003ECEE0FA
MAILAAGSLIVPAALPAARVILAPVPEDAAADYRLNRLPPGVYAPAIDAALNDDDPELADSLMHLAESRGVPVTVEQRDRVTAAQDFALGRSWRETWKGLTGGEASSPEALAGAVTADLTGVSDVRDLLREGGAYLNNQPYDALTLGLAAAGLVATGAIIVSLGTSTPAAAPARVGLTAIKVADKAGALKPPMRRALTALAVEVVDRPALEETLRLLRRGQLSAARQNLGRSVRAAPLQSLRTLAGDLGAVAAGRSYRAAYDVVKLADTPRDVSRLRALATRMGRGFRGTVALLGAGALSLSGLMASILGWLMAAVLWLLTAAYVVYRMTRVTVRWTVYFLKKFAGRSAPGRG